MAGANQPPPDDKILLDALVARLYANLALQVANAQETEAKFDVLDDSKRDSIKQASTVRFGGLTEAQVIALKRAMNSANTRSKKGP